MPDSFNEVLKVNNMNKVLIGVYGTLKRKGSNHGLLSDSTTTFLGEATSAPNYSMLSMGGYPAIVPGSDSVALEVFAVSNETLARLDRLEGHPSFYERREVEVLSEHGYNEVIWVYHLKEGGEYARSYFFKDEKGRLNWTPIENAKLYGKVA